MLWDCVREEGRLGALVGGCSSCVRRILTSEGPWVMLFAKLARLRALPGSMKTDLLAGRMVRLESSPGVRGHCRLAMVRKLIVTSKGGVPYSLNDDTLMHGHFLSLDKRDGRRTGMARLDVFEGGEMKRETRLKEGNADRRRR